MAWKVNPFDKFLKPEDHLGKQVRDWMYWQYPKVLWWHTPNEGKRTPFERYLAEILGIRAGVSDIIILEPRNTITGISPCLVIELKAGKNTLTENQVQFLKDCEDRGCHTAVCRKLEEVEFVVNSYLKNPKP